MISRTTDIAGGRVSSITITALLLAAASWFAPAMCNAQPTPAMFNSALNVLRDFVRLGDHRLGFRDTTEMVGASIDTNEVLMLNDEDSVLAAGFTWTIPYLHQLVYPVYAGDSLRSAIMFDSSAGVWEPVRFADGLEIRRYCASIKNDPRARRHSMLVMSEALQSDYVVMHLSPDSSVVVLPQPLLRHLSRHLPAEYQHANIVPLPVFHNALASMKK
jgi:hypothetical protein